MPPFIVHPFESFAKNIFGVVHMEKILEDAARHGGVDFITARDGIYEQMPPEARASLRKLAQHLSPPPTVPTDQKWNVQ